MAKHKSYLVEAEVTISIFTRVSATSPKAALREAKSRGMSSGLIDSGDEDEEWVTAAELDGSPMNLKIGDG